MGWTMDREPLLPVHASVHADSRKLLVMTAIAGIPARWVGVCPGCPLRNFPTLGHWL